MAKCLTEKIGIKWRGREDWDWYVDPGFLPAYTQEERRLLIDGIMRKYKEIFDCLPRSVGSWVIDAYSMEYVQKKTRCAGVRHLPRGVRRRRVHALRRVL